jgi:hypothetical protein
MVIGKAKKITLILYLTLHKRYRECGGRPSSILKVTAIDEVIISFILEIPLPMAQGRTKSHSGWIA